MEKIKILSPGLRKVWRLFAVVIPLILSGCKTEIPERAPTIEDFVGTHVTMSAYPENYPLLLHDLKVVDEDKDGDADVILLDPYRAQYVSEGHESELYDVNDAEIMTPKIQEAADNILKSGQNLAYVITNDVYEDLQKLNKNAKQN